MVRPANNHNGAKTTQRPRTFAQSINVPVDYVYFFYFHGLFGYLVLRAKNQHDLDHFDPNLRGIKIWLKVFVLRHAKPILFTKHLVVTTFQEGLIPNIHVKKKF